MYYVSMMAYLTSELELLYHRLQLQNSKMGSQSLNKPAIELRRGLDEVNEIREHLPQLYRLLLPDSLT